MTEHQNCELCGDPMPVGEEMFKYHGYSGPCPKPVKPLSRKHDDVANNGGPTVTPYGTFVYVEQGDFDAACAVVAKAEGQSAAATDKGRDAWQARSEELCETPECQHRCCACGHAECGHANENVQPNCSDCDCAEFVEAP